MCAAAGEAIGQPVNYYHMTDDAYVGMFSQFLGPAMAQEFNNMFAYFRDHTALFNGLRSIELTAKLVGGPLITAKQWALKHKATLHAIANK